MRILEEKNIKCSCGAELAYTEEDIHKNSGDNFIICPRCQSHIFINAFTPRKVCDNCGREYEAETYIGADGAEFAICPHCQKETFVDDGIELTIKNISYPEHFYKYNGVEISDAKTTEWIRECVAKIDKDSDYYLIGSGDTLCYAVKSDEESHEVTCYVCKKYSESHVTIPEEKF